MTNNKKDIEEVKINFIIDLIELKKNFLEQDRATPRAMNILVPNTSYNLLELLISHFMDKYNVDYSKLEELIYRRGRAIK